MASRKPKRAAKAKPAPKPVAKKPTRQVVDKAKKAPAKKKPKAVAKKASAPRPSPEKTVAKKAVAKKAVAKKTVAKKTVAKKTVAKKETVKRSPATEPARTGAPAKSAPAQKPGRTSRSTAKQSTPARDALSALAQKRAIKATLEPVAGGKEVVDAYLRDVDHPFKAEMEAVRQIILGASPKIAERIKWNAPSFYYQEDLGAFNPRATEYAHLILLFPGGAGMQAEAGLLEGEHKDRREVKFHGMDDVHAKRPALEKLIKRWVSLRDR